MKKITLSYSLNLFILLFIGNIAFSQVGINTTDPKGVLDFNSTTLGVVYPNVALLATNNSSPVVNPQGGAIVAGTVVYNTATTNTGAITDVSPGIYVWDGSGWVVHFKKRQSELHNQTAVLRTEADFAGGYQDVPGLGVGDAKTFTAKYSGLYRIEVNTNFGAGRTETNNTIFVSHTSGQFRFLFGGTPYTFETSAFSAYTNFINSGTHFEAIWKESYETNYVNLIAGVTYDFSLCFDAYSAPGFIGDGSNTPSGGPTLVTLINEEFFGYTNDMIDQISTPSGSCGPGGSTVGWEISTNSSSVCSGCDGDSLYINSNRNTCGQDATAEISFTPTLTSVNISFDYEIFLRGNPNERLRVFLEDGSGPVGSDLIDLLNLSEDGSYSGTIPVVPGIHTIYFEYTNTNRGNYASIDNVLITELSGPPTPVDAGLGYIGYEVDSQIEITYIGE